MKELIKEQFDLYPIEIKQLWGYDNLNYLLKTDCKKYIFKTYVYDADTFDLLQAENEVLEYVKSSKDLFPSPVKYRDNSLIKVIKIDGKERICRMLTFLDGEFLGDVKPSKKLFSSLGKTTAELDIKLQSFNNYPIKARRWKWDLQYLSMNKKYILDIPDARNRSLVEYYFQQYVENVIPLFPDLRKSIIHGDINEWNVLVKNNEINGIIDFGDLCYSPLINELAITIAYACLYVDDPLKMAEIIVESFNKVLPLTDEEISILYYLIPARLCVSVCNSAHERVTNPTNTYTAISEKLAWQFLHNWLKINPIEAENKFRYVTGKQNITKRRLEEVNLKEMK
ncbi:MAG: phosphotransferase [Planctomycetia bacterium]|nr:phosphotransferase [Planctomycetia bacterium]